MIPSLLTLKLLQDCEGEGRSKINRLTSAELVCNSLLNDLGIESPKDLAELIKEMEDD